MKKVWRIICAMALVVCIGLSFAACGGDKDGKDSGNANKYTLEFISDGTNCTLKGFAAEAEKSDKIQLSVPAEYEGKPVTKIADKAFQNEKRITSLTLPDSITDIGEAAFNGCTALESITFGTGLVTIGKMAFCSTGLKTLSLPSSVKTVERQAFDSNGSLESLTLAEGLETVDEYGFSGMFALTGKITIPDSVKSIAKESFTGAFTEIEIGDGLEEIPQSAIVSEQLTTVTVGENVKKINGWGFRTSYVKPTLTSVTFKHSTGWNANISDPAAAATVINKLLVSENLTRN